MARESEDCDLSAVAELAVTGYEAAPGATVGMAWREARGWRYGFGAAGKRWTEPPPPSGDRAAAAASAAAPPVRDSDWFDLASLTKPVVALTLARLHRFGLVDRYAPLATWLPALRATPSGEVSLDLLTAHRAGLEAHRHFYDPRPDAAPRPRDAILREAATARRTECTSPSIPDVGFPPVYSDLGYILVGAALEAATGLALDALIAREVTAHLAFGHPEGAARSLGSARQLVRRGEGDDEARAAFIPTERSPWRGGILQGQVHDNNAWTVAGYGTAGHAGLFGDVRAVVALGCAVLDGWAQRDPGWLRRADLVPLIDARPGGSHAAGFDHRSGAHPTSGSAFGPETFGHLGYTGTSLWLDPEAQRVGVLLSNRVHPTADDPSAIRAARPAVYDAMVTAVATTR
ncbi:MAG: serine hydrolase domain-containing protein [Myxococcota bacterium]